MDIKFYCQGCAMIEYFPTNCDNCPNLEGKCHKYNALLRNYKLFFALTNYDSIENKSVFRKL